MAWRTLLIAVVAALAAAPARAEDASRATAVRRQVGDRQVVVQRNGAVEVTVAGAKAEGRLSPEERSGLGAALKGLDVAALQAKLDELRADEAAPEVTIELVGLSDWSSTFVLPPSARAVRAGFAALEKVLDAVEARVAREAAAATVQRRGRLVPHEGGLALEADGARVVLGGETAATLQRLGESAWREVELLGRLERRAAGIERLVVDGARCRGVTVSGTLARASDGTLHLGDGVALGKPAADRRLAWFDGLVGHPLRVQGDLLVKGAAAKFAPGFKQLDRLEEELDWTTAVRDGKPRLLDPTGWPYEAAGPAAAFLNRLGPGTKVRLRAIRWNKQVIVSRVLATLAAPVELGGDSWDAPVVPAGTAARVIEVVGDEALVELPGVKDAKKVPVEALRLGGASSGPANGLTDRVTSAVR